MAARAALLASIACAIACSPSTGDADGGDLLDAFADDASDAGVVDASMPVDAGFVYWSL